MKRIRGEERIWRKMRKYKKRKRIDGMNENPFPNMFEKKNKKTLNLRVVWNIALLTP